MKIIPIFLFSLLLSLTAGSASAATKRGDVNGDGQVTIADVMLVVKVILGHETANAACDVNGDNTVSVADVTEVVKIILGGTSAPESDSTEIVDDPSAWEPANAPRRGGGQDTGRQVPPGVRVTPVTR
jgi:hypothetical protein